MNDEAFFDLWKKRYGKKVVASWSKKRIDLERWKYLEFARFTTNNVIPSFAYFLLHHLINSGSIKSIITTNYDLFLNSIFERTNKSHGSFCFNPVINNDDFDWEGYYSIKPRNPKVVKIFKIHGSLSHVVFRNCRHHNNQLHIFKLPSFVVGFDTQPLRREFGINYLHNYLGHVGLRHNQPTLINDEKRTGYYVHYIDWAVKCLCNKRIHYRDFFTKEIQYATRELKKSPDIGAIIIIGFTGYHNQVNRKDENNEELSPAIVSLLNKVPVFYFLHQHQYNVATTDPNRLYLWNAVVKVNYKQAVKYIDTGDLMLDLACGQKHLLRKRLMAIYKSDWVNGNLFKDYGTL